MKHEYLYGHMVQEYYVDRLRQIARERAEARARVRTRADVMRLREEVRRKLRRSFGPMPPRTPLKPRVTGVVDRADYRIEKVLYESRPGFPVTANLYVPKRGAAPHPAVLVACGHALDAKAYGNYQACAKNFARQGYVVLIYDPVSQGERIQYLGLPKKQRPGGMCSDHNMMGSQLHLVGEFFGLWRTWDGIRSLDYLLSRPEVDRTRVGVTGNSGGGTLSTYLTGLDDRFAMAAPNCFVTRYLSNMENELPADSEQIPPGMLAEGLDLADFFVAQIPRPTILEGQQNDFFDPRGLESVYEELRRLYSIVGREDDVALFIGPGSHDFSAEAREALYRFFNRHAGVRASAQEPRPLKLELPATLQVTPGGQVHSLRSREVSDFAREKAGALAARRKPVRGAALREAVVAALALPERRGAPHYRVMQPRRIGEKRVLECTFAVETEPGIQAALHSFPASALFHLPEGREATLYVPHLSAEQEVLAGQAPKAPLLFALDVRGIGQMTALTCSDEEFSSPYGCDFFYASHGLMLNEPYSGRRVHDLLCVLDLFAAKGYRSVHLVGRGLGSLWATFAGVLHRAVTRVTLHNALLSYHELTQTPVHRWPLSALVFGVLKEFDLPDCLRELARTKRLALMEPWDARMRPVKAGDARARMRFLGLD